MLDISRLTLALDFTGVFFSSRVRRLQVPPQPHIQRDRNAHHDQRAATQDQEPPDHPHNRLA
jgi:hypothetical protein